MSIRWLLVCWLLALPVDPAASAERTAAPPEMAAPDAAPPSAQERFADAAKLEEQGRLLVAAERFAALCAKETERSDACWRASRAYWRHGDALPYEAEEARLRVFTAAETLAGQGLERDPRCGGCALWRYAAIGRLTDIHGWVWAARRAREMQRLLNTGIAARPTHRDSNGNTTLANLYYASAVFHRMTPEWWWLPIFVGVKGDVDRARRDIEEALAFQPDRIEYRVEHGAVLLCGGVRRGQDERIAEGRTVLQAAAKMKPVLPTDPVDQRYAQEMIQYPDRACAFSRRGYIDVEGEGRAVATGFRD